MVQGNPKEFILEGEWEVNSITGQGMTVGLWFYHTKHAPGPNFISPEEKKNCYLIYQTGEVEPETKPPEEEVKELHYLWSLGIQSGVNRALSYLNKRGLVSGPVHPKVKKKNQKSGRYNSRGDPVFKCSGDKEISRQIEEVKKNVGGRNYFDG